MEAKFGASDKGMKNDWRYSRRKFLERRDTQFLTTKEEILGELKL
jgi:hypothetical protein